MKILVIFSNRLGDILMCLPFVEGIKSIYPESKIYAVVNKEFVEIIKLVPLISGSYHKVKSPYSSFVGNLQTANTIRKDRQFDLCFCLSDSFSAALIAYFSRIKIRVGYRFKGRSFLLTHTYIPSKKIVPNPIYSYRLLENYIGKIVEKRSYKISLTPREKSNLPSGLNLIFNMNSLGKSRIIPIWKAVEIITGIQQKYDFNIILIGAPYEKDSVDQLVGQLNSEENIYNFAGKSSLTELTYMLSEADIVVSTDTGTAHLANSVGTNLIVFFGAGDQKKTSPFNSENLVILNKHLPCSPCLTKDCKFEEPICLTQIDNIEIFNAIDRFLVTP